MLENGNPIVIVIFMVTLYLDSPPTETSQMI